MVLKSRPVVAMAGVSQILRGRMAEWLRPADCEVLTIKLRGINYQFAHLVSEKSPYGTLRWFQSRPRFYMAPASADILNFKRFFSFRNFQHNDGRIDFFDPSIIISNNFRLTSHSFQFHRLAALGNGKIGLDLGFFEKWR
jgi:hypothetical protein